MRIASQPSKNDTVDPGSTSFGSRRDRSPAKSAGGEPSSPYCAHITRSRAALAGNAASNRLLSVLTRRADHTKDSIPHMTISISNGLPTTSPSTHSQRLPHHSFQTLGGSPEPSNSIARLHRSPTREENVTGRLILLDLLIRVGKTRY